MNTEHVPVMLDEVIEAFSSLAELETPMLLDCTLGGGGHAEALLEENEKLFLVGTDRDQKAVDRVTKRLAKFSDRTEFLKANFSSLSESSFRDKLPVKEFDGVLVDLGISSDQLNDSERGFSFSKNGPLDMRLDQEQDLTAYEVVNSYTWAKLKGVFQKGGLGAESGVLANKIIENRPVEDTAQLLSICRELKSAKTKPGKNPGTVPFQAIRIEVNKEFVSIENLLSSLPDFLAPGGKLVAISFHSLEDKLVARSLRSYSRSDSQPRRLPEKESRKSFGELLTKKALKPSEEEIKRNPRARSALIRIFVRN